MHLSIVIPVYNEAGNIKALAEEIEAVLPRLGGESEIIWVDDGSSDSSYAELSALVRAGGPHKAVRFGRNFGQTAAIAAGIAEASGEFIALLDADLQNDPADLPAMLAKMGEGFDVVSGWRKDRKDPFLTKVFPSRVANAIIASVTGVRIHDYGCTLKVYRSLYLKSFRIYGEMHRFMPAFAGAMGARIAELPVHHRPRSRGKSNYGLTRTAKVMLDLATVKFMGQYLSKPIYLFGGWGLLLGFTSVILAAVTLYKKYCMGIFVKDQPLFLVAIFLGIISVQMILLGLLSEIISRTYYEINSRQPYFVKEKAGFGAEAAKR